MWFCQVLLMPSAGSRHLDSLHSKKRLCSGATRLILNDAISRSGAVLIEASDVMSLLRMKPLQKA